MQFVIYNLHTAKIHIQALLYRVFHKSFPISCDNLYESVGQRKWDILYKEF